MNSDGASINVAGCARFKNLSYRFGNWANEMDNSFRCLIFFPYCPFGLYGDITPFRLFLRFFIFTSKEPSVSTRFRMVAFSFPCWTSIFWQMIVVGSSYWNMGFCLEPGNFQSERWKTSIAARIIHRPAPTRNRCPVAPMRGIIFLKQNSTLNPELFLNY